MSGAIPSRGNSLPIEAQQHIDAACDRFEAAWLAGQDPRIEAYLAENGEEIRGPLFRELLKLEIEFRGKDGQTPPVEEYAARFPDRVELVQSIFAGTVKHEDYDAAPGCSGFENTPDNPCQNADSNSEPDTPRSPELPPPTPATIGRGRYKVLRRLGGGSFGDVYVAHDEVMRRQVAIKVPNVKLLKTKRARDEFLHEARSVSQLECDGIVRAYDFGQEEDQFCYIVYEYVEGVTLADRARNGTVAPDEVAHIVACVAEALHFAHQKGVTHQDIKPANILLDQNGKPRVADFGLAVREEDLAGQRGRLAGTWPYLSPEQVRGEGHHLDGRSDIYSLGVVLYELLCNRRPFSGKTENELADQILHREAKPPRQIKDSIPQELERICLKALSKRVQERYTTAKDMATELRQAVTNGAIPHPSREPPIDFKDIEQRIGSLGENELRHVLLRLSEQAFEAGCIPLLCRCLAHNSAPVRDQARKAVHNFGWDKIAAAATNLAQHNDSTANAAVLDGLAAFEAHPQVVALLDRLVVVLKGDLRNRAILLMERKRLGLDLDAVAALFCEIKSPYRIEKALGQGLFTATYLARIDESDFQVVVRVLRPEFVGQPLLRAQFFDLNQRSLRLVDKNLVLTREARAFPDRNMYFAVRDYVDGVTLQKVLAGGKRFESEQIVRIIDQLLMALEPVHRLGLCHCGVKPSNIFLCDGDRVVLGDLSLPVQGIGVALDRLSYDYRYVAPEMFGGKTGPEADFYALGCVAYELACGSPPFVADNYLELAARHFSDVITPPSARGSFLGVRRDNVLLKMLARSAGDRYAKTDDIRQALSRAAAQARGGLVERQVQPPFVGEGSMEHYRGNESVMGLDSSFAAEDLPSDSTFPGGLGAPMPALEQPTRIGRFNILDVLGQGGMGIVYKAQDSSLDRIVALKMLRFATGGDSHLAARFLTEARAAAQLQHPNILQTHEIGDERGHAYLVQEFVGAGSLAQKLRLEGPQQPRDAAKMVATLARAVHRAHELGILHRDLKPSNILLTEDGQPKISDFGLAKIMKAAKEDQSVTMVGTIMGTPFYMSPEQATGKVEEIGPATDIYSLGVILYELLTGKPPFAGTTVLETLSKLATVSAVRPSVSNKTIDRVLDDICLKCLEKEPKRRYVSAADLADDLDRWRDGKALAAKPVGAPWWRRLFPVRDRE